MDCPQISEVSYIDFSKQLNKKVVTERTPIAGSFEPTFRCNLKCAHCYVAREPGKKEMTYEEIRHILDEIAGAGCLWLLISGGEPFVRSDFLDIYTYAKKKGLLITLFTNGTLITPKIADYLRDWPPFVVEISLYGITKETYERVTGVAGSFEHCMKGIELLIKRNVPLRLKTMVMTLNHHELWEIKKYVEDLGIEFRFDAIINPKLNGSMEPCKLRISPEEVVELDSSDDKRVKAKMEFCRKFWGPAESSDRLYTCNAGKTSFHIDPYGQMSICEMSRSPSYNLLQRSIQDGWRDFVDGILSQKPKGEYQCAKCDLHALCGQCPGWAQLENGNPETPVEYLCQIAHLQAEVFGPKKQ